MIPKPETNSDTQERLNFRHYAGDLRAIKMSIDWAEAQRYGDSPPFHVLFSLSQPQARFETTQLRKATILASLDKSSAAHAYIKIHGLSTIMQGMHFALSQWNCLNHDQAAAIALQLGDAYPTHFLHEANLLKNRQRWSAMQMEMYSDYHRYGQRDVINTALAQLGYPPGRMSYRRALKLIHQFNESEQLVGRIPTPTEIAAMLLQTVPPEIPKIERIHLRGLLGEIAAFNGGNELVSELFSFLRQARAHHVDQAWSYYVEGHIFKDIAGGVTTPQNVSNHLAGFRSSLRNAIPQLPPHLVELANLMLMPNHQLAEKKQVISRFAIDPHIVPTIEEPTPLPTVIDRPALLQLRVELVEECAQTASTVYILGLLLEHTNQRLPLETIAARSSITLKHVQDAFRRAQDLLMQHILLNHKEFATMTDLLVGNFPAYLEEHVVSDQTI